MKQQKIPYGDIPWLQKLTGWSYQKATRMVRKGRVPGAFRVGEAIQGSPVQLVKSRVLHWWSNTTGEPIAALNFRMGEA